MTPPVDCPFCLIASGELEATIVAETEWSLAFRDLHPQAPTHVLVIPRRHVEHVAALAEAAPAELADLCSVAARVASSAGLTEGYRSVFNTGPDAGQTVFHAHLHVLGGRAMTWPPG